MTSFKDILRWYNNKDVVATLEAMQKWLIFSTKKISICWSLVVHYQTWLTFAYTNLPIRNSIISQREIKTSWKKFEKTSLVVHLSFSHAKQLLMKPLSENLQTCANLLLGLMPGNYTTTGCLTPCPPCHYTRWHIVSETSRFTPRQNKTRSFEKMIMSYFQRTRPDCKIESFYTTDRQKKYYRFSVDGFCSHYNSVFEAMGCFYHFCPVKSSAHISLKKISNVALGKENSMNWDEAIYRRKVSLPLKCGNVSGGDFTR